VRQLSLVIILMAVKLFMGAGLDVEALALLDNY